MSPRQDFFANLPSDIVIEILSRLPIRAIITCKCVRKSWLALLQTPEFADSHRLREVVVLALYDSTPKVYTFFDIEDGVDLENHRLRFNPAIKFNLPFKNGWLAGSVNGLILHCHQGKPLTLYLCNPLTRDYIELHRPQELRRSSHRVAALGFGASKISGQYKVVMVFQDNQFLRNPKSDCNCYVYTIGTGVWRKITPPASNLNGCRVGGVFLHGNLHWLVSDVKASQSWIVCFDLENELFSTFSSPLLAGSNTLAAVLCALGDTLCICENKAEGVDIWLMKEYRVEESWTKQFVINNSPAFDRYSYEVIYPIMVFKDCDILMGWKLTNFLFYYSKKNNIVHKINRMFESNVDIKPFFHTPSFLSLRSFGRENVRSI